ncbi:MAG: chorismate mutase [Actinomycetota bacterium]|nr:chorismate mutase [Actinomycetota bacterium]
MSATSEPRVRAVRGAVTLDEDTKDEVVKATAELLREVMERNGLMKQDLVSLVFTATPDITSEFPAAAARGMGISDIPLLCAQEIDVAGAIPRCIRVLVHAYTTRDYTSLRHVYLKDARQLRTDLPE